ncbi:hypothetical protein OPV22_032178 [Ensete ventricosum]|uniref:glucose-6-phosphate 1-epimerase n=1 Tax=Ensete ventricosum TaxID=4639 RepID=A0AAV8PVV9_ENSVE|nr:hypothetical protein OPV22_032178 [Ensete ventricosum]
MRASGTALQACTEAHGRSASLPHITHRVSRLRKKLSVPPRNGPRCKKGHISSDPPSLSSPINSLPDHFSPLFLPQKKRSPVSLPRGFGGGREWKEAREGSIEGEGVGVSGYGIWPMSGEKPPVEICKGVNGLDKVVLREVRGSSAEVYLYGGHVTSWKNDHSEELLFLSTKAIFKPPKAIRGGIPICFPQFGSHGNLEQHGFARNRLWSIDTDPPPFPTVSSNKAFIDLIFKPSEDDFKIWPHSYEFRLRITLGPGGDLMLTSRIRNTDGKPFSFTFAYHTYFSVSDISEVRVEGLETLDYLDNLKAKERFTEQGDAITFESEVDKIYLGTPSKIAILDHEKKRTFVLRKDGLPDAVVWNPWEKKAKSMADFGDDEYKHMLCLPQWAAGSSKGASRMKIIMLYDLQAHSFVGCLASKLKLSFGGKKERRRDILYDNIKAVFKSKAHLLIKSLRLNLVRGVDGIQIFEALTLALLFKARNNGRLGPGLPVAEAAVGGKKP